VGEQAGRLLLGIDVGGTFTDFVACDPEARRVDVWKTLSTPGDPTDGVLAGVERLGAPSAIEHLRLGTTIATNTILERKGACVAYVTTRGFRDIPFIQRGNRRSHYDIAWVKPAALVKRRHAFEVDERVDRDGRVVKPLDDDEVRALAQEIRATGAVDAVAVNLLFSFLEPAHERRIAAIFAAELPGVPVSISYDVLPKWKEYERASTTLADAYLKPRIGKDLKTLRRRFDAAGLTDNAVVIKSNGGEMTLDAAAEAPIHLTMSGPTGGVIAAQHLAGLKGIDHLVTLDMGGTSTDCSTIAGGGATFTTDHQIEFGLPIQIPMIDIRTIGAGGGSIAWIDKGGMLRVGPESAGADPGPVCYGRGGTQATVTDANVVLGRISPDNFLGGRMALDAHAAEAAVAQLAAGTGLTVAETALAIVRIANTNMTGALRAVLIERGHDPRDFALLAFGGAGPLHLADLMHEAGVPTGIVPRHPGQFSAFGFLLTDARVDRHRTVQLTSGAFDPERANEAMAELVVTAEGELAAQGYAARPFVRRALEMRYLGQNYELEVPIAFERFDRTTTTELWHAFHELHQARFGFHIPGEVIEVVNFMVTAIAATDKPAFAELAPADVPPVPAGDRPVKYEEGVFETIVYQRDGLMAGHEIDGPAVIEEDASVTVVRPGQRCTVDALGNLTLEG